MLISEKVVVNINEILVTNLTIIWFIVIPQRVAIALFWGSFQVLLV